MLHGVVVSALGGGDNRQGHRTLAAVNSKRLRYGQNAPTFSDNLVQGTRLTLVSARQ